MNKSSQNIESFDINQQFQNLLKHSQDMYLAYEHLLIRLQSLIATLDKSIQLVFDDIIDLYNKQIEGDNEAVFNINVEFLRFNEMKKLHNYLISVLEDSKKEHNHE